MKQPVPPQPSPSQQNLAATVTLGLLMVVFLLIPVLSPRPTLAPAPSQPATMVGPAVPLDHQPWHPQEGEAAWAPSSGFLARMQRMSLALLAMSVVIFISLRVVNKFYPGLLKPGSKSRLRTPLMEVLERQTVAPGVNLAVVRVGTKTLVLGMTDHSVSTVCELAPEDMPAEPVVEETAVEEAAPAPTDVYRGIFRQYLSIIPGMGGSKR